MVATAPGAGGVTLSPCGCDVATPPAALPRRKKRAHSMATPSGPREDAVAKRIDPARDPGLSTEQRRLVQNVEYAHQQRVMQRRLRGRNALLALGIGSITLGIYAYTFYSISQERFLDDLEEEAAAARARAAKSATS
ncbi:PREDICTED: cytochrome c oxidase assembly factor 3 homolog, mitochondrial [Crocodylus porosus]|uniref:cytochrome c oxidase assembly factor 3 homolog, mitochondrial n=1 Tax=Crocodylus porosus TaxID=8502 RepID=UPI00093C3E7D|nr:PREDICTED: cytochrome c oxidase assembly factor 3 homolog, mitochondrial [Crocodylus porosus]